MPTNYAEFERQVQEAAKAGIEKFVELHRTVTLKGYQYTTADTRSVSFQFGSPVWTGRFRASFNVSVGAPNYAVKPPHPEIGNGLVWPDDPGAPYKTSGVAAAAAQIVGLQPFDQTHIANGLPYARLIEKGYSIKAPAGVLNVVAERLAKEFDGVTIQT